LIKELGGPELAGVGFAFGVERMQLAAARENAGGSSCDVIVAPLDGSAAGGALALARRLRRVGWSVEVGPSDRKLKAHLKRADKVGASYAVLIGEDELRSGEATVRTLVTRSDHPGCFALDADGRDIGERLERTNEVEA
jgi:histidyl-tRNA synthetase